ncbi:MAG: OmpH family outer membrane protein [Maritimibacter sp.]
MTLARAQIFKRGLVSLALVCLCLLGSLAAPHHARAQQQGQVVSPIFTLDQQRLFLETNYGARIMEEREAMIETLAAETLKIEAALEAEESALTEKRANMPAEEFRALALDFDARVRLLRQDRDQAEANLNTQFRAAQDGFWQNVGPVVAGVVRARGGVVLLEARSVLMQVGDVDITTEAVEIVNQTLGEGPKAQYFLPLEDPTPTPQTAPTPIDETDEEGLIQQGEAPAETPIEPAPVLPSE